jgi:hypothetical protein
MELIKDNVMVEWVELGEGFWGDYNPENPEDEELLRFDVSVWNGQEWTEVPDASYCTLFPVSASNEAKMTALREIMEVVYKDVRTGRSIKRSCENLSWISLDWITNEKGE